MLNLDHKNHGPGVLGALKLGGQGTTQPARTEGADDMSVAFPLSYHLETGRVFVPYFEHVKPGSAETAWSCGHLNPNPNPSHNPNNPNPLPLPLALTLTLFLSLTLTLTLTRTAPTWRG